MKATIKTRDSKDDGRGDEKGQVFEGAIEKENMYESCSLEAL